VPSIAFARPSWVAGRIADLHRVSRLARPLPPSSFHGCCFRSVAGAGSRLAPRPLPDLRSAPEVHFRFVSVARLLRRLPGWSPVRGYHGACTVRARPVRPSRRSYTRVTCRRAHEGRDGTSFGTITHGDRSPGGPRAPTSAADPDCAARFGVCPQMPVKRFVRFHPVTRMSSAMSVRFSGAAQSAGHNASSVVSAASAVAGELAGAGPLSADGVSGRLAKSATRWDTSIEPGRLWE